MEVNQTFIKVRESDPEYTYSAVRGPNTYLLESIGGSLKKARYSFIGFNPAAKLSMKDGSINLETFDPEFKAEPKGENAFDVLESLISPYPSRGPSLSRFSGGFVGYMGYDVVRGYVSMGHAVDDLKQPDCEFVLTKNNIIFDHKTRETYLVENHFLGGSEVDVEASLRRLEDISHRIVSHQDAEAEDATERIEPIANMSRQEFESAVSDAKDYIREGDAFQIVLSQRLTRKYEGDKFRVYQRLRQINPSPYMYFLDFGEREVVGSSPETLARVEGRTVSTYPIAGTRKRGKDSEEDDAMEKELLADEKEKAEHLMLIDLGRNDVGKVAEYGSVKVPKFMEVERYSHVMHLSSEVTGTLKEGLTEFNALKSIFPAGTVSGAPKIRAMEIIDELEPTRRGIYAGAIGYFSFNRSMDTAIAIRTVVFEKDEGYVQVGAGIVADSKPELEYKETMNKGKALLKALEAGK
ncbi:MAG: anthranilate synthase component I [Candidatus Altiarchaeota archaeon]